MLELLTYMTIVVTLAIDLLVESSLNNVVAPLALIVGLLLLHKVTFRPYNSILIKGLSLIVLSVLLFANISFWPVAILMLGLSFISYQKKVANEFISYGLFMSGLIIGLVLLIDKQFIITNPDKNLLILGLCLLFVTFIKDRKINIYLAAATGISAINYFKPEFDLSMAVVVAIIFIEYLFKLNSGFKQLDAIKYIQHRITTEAVTEAGSLKDFTDKVYAQSLKQNGAILIITFDLKHLDWQEQTQGLEDVFAFIANDIRSGDYVVRYDEFSLAVLLDCDNSLAGTISERIVGNVKDFNPSAGLAVWDGDVDVVNWIARAADALSEASISTVMLAAKTDNYFETNEVLESPYSEIDPDDDLERVKISDLSLNISFQNVDKKIIITKYDVVNIAFYSDQLTDNNLLDNEQTIDENKITISDDLVVDNIKPKKSKSSKTEKFILTIENNEQTFSVTQKSLDFVAPFLSNSVIKLVSNNKEIFVLDNNND